MVCLWSTTSYKGTNPAWGPILTASSKPNYLTKILSLNSIPLRTKAPTSEFERKYNPVHISLIIANYIFFLQVSVGVNIPFWKNIKELHKTTLIPFSGAATVEPKNSERLSLLNFYHFQMPSAWGQRIFCIDS